MFGSNFSGNFGLPDFPYQGQDPQGGYLGVNIEPSADPAAAGSAVGGLPGGPITPAPGGSTPGSPVPAPQPSLGSPLAQPSPLAPPSQSPVHDAAPAAGVGSPFNKIGAA